MRDEKKALETFRRLMQKLVIEQMTKGEAFWHMDVKNTRLCKSVLPCFWGVTAIQVAFSKTASVVCPKSNVRQHSLLPLE